MFVWGNLKVHLKPRGAVIAGLMSDECHVGSVEDKQ